MKRHAGYYHSQYHIWYDKTRRERRSKTWKSPSKNHSKVAEKKTLGRNRNQRIQRNEKQR